MFNSVALNVVIGLIFIYLLYSLLATTINEAIASVFNLRAKKLQLAITKMLNDGIHTYDNIWDLLDDTFSKAFTDLKNFFIYFSLKQTQSNKTNKSLLELFYDHPGIKYLGENKISNKPAYISPDFFSKTVIDILSQKANNKTDPKIKQVQAGIDAIKDSNETKEFIQSLLEDANNDLDKFKVALEQWFNETMLRTSGWYKKQSQKITFCIGFVLAIAFNVDTISLVKKLSNDPDAAKALSDMATQYAEAHKDSTGQLKKEYVETSKEMFDEAKKQINGDITNANSIIGLGWSIPSDTSEKNCTVENNAINAEADLYNCHACVDTLKKGVFGYSIYINKTDGKINTVGKARYVICMAFSSGRRILGYLLTALAISFGAPFWFDLLNKLVQIRGAGKKPEESTTKNDSKKTEVKRVG